LANGLAWPYALALAAPPAGPTPWKVPMKAPDCAMTWGSALRAKAPVATTKTAVPIAAAGRSHARRRRGCAASGLAGLNRSMTGPSVARSHAARG
jgi:hypothetical protein